MTPRSIDAQNRAQDLSTKILSSTTPSQILSSISAIHSFLLKHASDQSRSFFSITFPSLICRIFGFDNNPSWLLISAQNPEIFQKLFSLLSPDGMLISSIGLVDKYDIIKYVFPNERLPEWFKYVFDNESFVGFYPLFRGRVKDGQLCLNAFEYYMFWFAYYPVCKGNNESAESGVVGKSFRRKFRLENWTSSFVSGSSSKSSEKKECDLYARLLYAYLRAFVPKFGVGACHLPYRSSLLQHRECVYDEAVFVQAEFLVHTLVNFWMVDNDFSPLNLSFCRSYGIVFPFRAVLGETPPTPGLGEVLMLLIKYLNCYNSTSGKNEQMVYNESVVKSVESFSAGSWNLVMQRPLYRFLLRSFLFCPMGASIKNTSQVFSLWAMYLTPWNSSDFFFEEFEMPIVQNSNSLRKKDASSESKKKDARREERVVEIVYTPIWESYVAYNYLFYSSLVVHFLGFAHKFLHTNVDAVVQMVLKVLNILTSSNELMDFLRKVDIAYHANKQSGPFSSYADNAQKYVPSIREQLQDWEDGLCESDADGSFLHENWNCDLKLFSDEEDGAAKVLQLFVLRAEHEIQVRSGDLENLNAIKSKMTMLFGAPVMTSYTTPLKMTPNSQHDRVEVFTPKHPHVKYKGDWIRRPISDNEVAWLAKILINLSNWLNDNLGFNRAENNTDSTGLTYVDVPCEETVYVGGIKEAFVMLISLIASWLFLIVQLIPKFMRGHGMRINLRILASKKVVMVLFVYGGACVLKKALWSTTS